MVEKIEKEEEFRRREAAAIQIQRYWRGYA
jgi:hypothetical protein